MKNIKHRNQLRTRTTKLNLYANKNIFNIMKLPRETAQEVWRKKVTELSSKKTEWISEDVVIDAMLEMYHLDRPKVVVFDANDPNTFPKKDGLYHIKVHGIWIKLIWD